jgi:Putative nuclear envelope organisation protein
LKSFLDYHGVPNPTPRTRDTLLQTARSNYASIVARAGETAAYPGDWLYSQWSDSDLKAWLDERGIPAPQPTTRDKLIAQVRRNARQASLKLADTSSSASSAAASASSSAFDALLNTWSDSDIKKWADKNGLKVPQGSNTNELKAFARKHYASVSGDNVSDKVSASGASAFGAATSKANNAYAKATDDASLAYESAWDSAIATWSDTRLKAYLDSRGVPVPQNGKKDELLAKVRLHKHKASTGYGAWTFDTWTTENLKKYLNEQASAAGAKTSEYKDASRDELVASAQAGYATTSKKGGEAYSSASSYLAQATDSVAQTTFDTWSDSDLKHYLDSYGVPVYQGTKTNELKALARKQYNYFKYGSSSPQGTVYAQLKGWANWVVAQLGIGAKKANAEAGYQSEKAKHRVEEQAAHATNRVKEEL